MTTNNQPIAPPPAEPLAAKLVRRLRELLRKRRGPLERAALYENAPAARRQEIETR